MVTEGNYLLLEDGGWPDARAQLDAVWHVVTDDERAPAAAGRPARAVRQDARAGARVGRAGRRGERLLVEAAAHRADVVLDLSCLGSAANAPG